MRFIYLFLVCALPWLGTSCAKAPSSPTKPLIIVSVSPYDTFVKEIAGDTVDVRAAVPANFNPHLFEPTPKQVEGFQTASLWLGIGEPFEKSILKSLASYNPQLNVIDLSKEIPVDYENDLSLTPCDTHHHHHHDEGIDRHFWMNPALVILQVKEITKVLSQTFPEHTKLYEHNMTLLVNKLGELNHQLHHMLQPINQTSIIVSHPSLGYFCKEYNILQISIECEGKTPLPNDLKKILDLAKKNHPLCVFTQEQFDNKGALLIADRLHLPIYSINPNAPDYFSTLTTLADQLLKSSHSMAPHD